MPLRWISCPGVLITRKKAPQDGFPPYWILRPCNPKPHEVYLPRIYEEPLNYLYGGLDDKRQIHISASEQLPDIPTELNTQVFDFAKVARVAVNQAGRDFTTVLGQEEKKDFRSGCDCDSGLAESRLALDQYHRPGSSDQGLFFRRPSSPLV